MLRPVIKIVSTPRGQQGEDGNMTNPMTTGGDIIYGGASGEPTRLANGSVAQVLTSSGGTDAPVWSDPVADASTTVKGKVELATDAEAITGTDTVRAVTPASLKATLDAQPPSGDFLVNQVFN
jgi:hypothetical protein